MLPRQFIDTSPASAPIRLAHRCDAIPIRPVAVLQRTFISSGDRIAGRTRHGEFSPRSLLDTVQGRILSPNLPHIPSFSAGLGLLIPDEPLRSDTPPLHGFPLLETMDKDADHLVSQDILMERFA